jgi:hypothetical protein
VAFDVYAGTFTRFYTRDWENVVQKQAKLDGMEYHMIYAGGDSGPPPSSEVLLAVSAWKEGMNSGLAPHGFGPIEWSEDEQQPYFTDRPGWEGYSGLLLWAAYSQVERKTPPYAVPEVWAEDAAYQAAIALEKPRFPAVLMANIWLPGEFEFHFKFPALAGNGEVMIASTGSLLKDLREMRADEPAWAKESFLSKLPRRKQQVRLEEAARYGLVMFTELVECAVDSKLPLILSF